MKYFEQSKNEIYIGDKPKLGEWINLSPMEKVADETEEHKNAREQVDKEIEGIQSLVVDRVKQMIKNYLELDNVSFLFGSGTSLHLGAVSIRNFPKEVEDYIKAQDSESYKFLKEIIIKLQHEQILYAKSQLNDDEEAQEDKLKKFIDKNKWNCVLENGIVRELIIISEEEMHVGEIIIEYEKVLNNLLAREYIFREQGNEDCLLKCNKLVTLIKEGLFQVCDIDSPNRIVPSRTIEQKRKSGYEVQERQAELLKGPNKYVFHEKFVKSILQRPLNLKRATIFTSNYDLAFEYTFDRLGVHYIDGFAGFHKRCFKPETFEYDIFYPGSTTVGKVQRIEKVVRYIKLHGSLSWVNSESRDANNLYGIEEKPLKLIELQEKQKEVIIYPSAVKKSYTLDLPYSELFRQFALTISQPQSVLFTIGYSFGDEHFNDIIFQALSNPSFTLIVVDYSGTKNPYIQNLKVLGDPRIIILEGDFFGDFLTFSSELMPNFDEVTTNMAVAKTLDNLFSKK